MIGGIIVINKVMKKKYKLMSTNMRTNKNIKGHFNFCSNIEKKNKEVKSTIGAIVSNLMKKRPQ